jgi:hypothetical protein
MNKHQPDHDRQHDNDNVIAFPVDRRVRPVEDPRFEVSGFWWTQREWDEYEAHVRESFGL